MLDKDIANIQDIYYAIEHIEEYVDGIARVDDLLKDTKTYDAVLMNFSFWAKLQIGFLMK
jgi:uncharacterized protein with HEPN domain